jgi:hypothetical protein
MRRGDFVTHGWVMEGSVQSKVHSYCQYSIIHIDDGAGHYERIKSRLKKGKEILEVLRISELKPYDVPDVQVNEALHTREPPRDDDA